MHIRVLMLNYEFPPLGGGAANATYYILKRMQGREDLEVDLVTSSPGATTFERWEPNITLHKIDVKKKAIHYWTQLEVLRWSWYARRQIKALMAEKDYDVCHAFFGIPCGFVASLFRKDLPYIVSLRGSDVPGFNDRFAFQYILLKPLIRRVWRQANIVVALSEEGREDAWRTDSGRHIEIIPNGINTDEFCPRPDVRMARRTTDSRVWIICTSRLVARKGVDYLIKALPALKRYYGNFVVQIIGDGNIKEKLIKLTKDLDVEDMVQFRGYLKHDKLPGEYQASDIFVLPSLTEAFCNSRIEAMACGLPIVTTNTGGVRAVMGERRGIIADNGFVVSPRAPEALCSTLEALIKDEDLREEMGQKSLEHIAKFTWESVTDSYVRLYEKVAGGQPSTSVPIVSDEVLLPE